MRVEGFLSILDVGRMICERVVRANPALNQTAQPVGTSTESPTLHSSLGSRAAG